MISFQTIFQNDNGMVHYTKKQIRPQAHNVSDDLQIS